MTQIIIQFGLVLDLHTSVRKPWYAAALGGVSDVVHQRILFPPLFLFLALSLDMIVLKELTEICSLVSTARPCVTLSPPCSQTVFTLQPQTSGHNPDLISWYGFMEICDQVQLGLLI